MTNEPVTVTIEEGFKVELTPEVVAKAFWEMDTVGQADFFECLARCIQEKTPNAYRYGELQWCYLKDELRQPHRKLANEMHMSLSAFAYDFWTQRPYGARDTY